MIYLQNRKEEDMNAKPIDNAIVLEPQELWVL
jgi:hypothetical protein